MENEDTEYQKIVFDRYLHQIKTEEDKSDMIFLVIAPTEHGYEDEMLKWLNTHPDATFQEAVAYREQIRPPIEIYDDEDEVD